MLKIIIIIAITIYLLPLLLFLFTKDEKEEYQCEILEKISKRKIMEELEKGKEE